MLQPPQANKQITQITTTTKTPSSIRCAKNRSKRNLSLSLGFDWIHSHLWRIFHLIEQRGWKIYKNSNEANACFCRINVIIHRKQTGFHSYYFIHMENRRKKNWFNCLWEFTCSRIYFVEHVMDLWFRTSNWITFLVVVHGMKNAVFVFRRSYFLKPNVIRICYCITEYLTVAHSLYLYSWFGFAVGIFSRIVS